MGTGQELFPKQNKYCSPIGGHGLHSDCSRHPGNTDRLEWCWSRIVAGINGENLHNAKFA